MVKNPLPLSGKWDAKNTHAQPCAGFLREEGGYIVVSVLLHMYIHRFVASTVPSVELGGGVFFTMGLLTVGLLTVGLQRLQRLAVGLLWRDHLLGGSPLPPKAWAGRPRRPVCGRKRLRCSAPPSARFTLWGLRVGLHQVPTTSFPSGFLLLLLRLGAVPGGGAAAAAAGARGVEVYMTASSTHIPVAAAALSCILRTSDLIHV